MFDNKNIYKDFISNRKFSEILRKLLNINAHGVFNISIGEKIFLKDLVNWLNHYNKSKNIDLVKIPNNFKRLFIKRSSQILQPTVTGQSHHLISWAQFLG